MNACRAALFLVMLLTTGLAACASPTPVASPEASPLPLPSETSPPPWPSPTLPPTPLPLTPSPGVDSFELLGHAGGNLTAVALDGEHAYLAVGARLVVLDLSDPQGPQEVFRSEVQPVTATGLALGDGRLYWLSHTGRLLVFDLGTPENPSRVADVEILPGGQAIAVQGGWLYIAESLSPTGEMEFALRVYDLSDPLHPLEVARLALPTQAVDLTVAGDRAYVTLWAGAVSSVDISDPARPAILYTVQDLYGVYVQPPYLFAAEMENLAFYDLSSTDKPEQLAAWPIDREPRLNSVFAGGVYENLLYLFDSSSPPCGGDVSPSCPVSFHVLDITDPRDPQSLSGPAENPEFDRVSWAEVLGERLYVQDYHGLHALSLADPAHPQPAWHYAAAPTDMEAYDLTSRDGFVYLGVDLLWRSLYAFDLRDLAAPRLAGPFEPSIATSGVLSGSTLYLSMGPDGLSVLDVSEPLAPVEVARVEGSVLTLSGNLRRPLAVLGDTLYASLDYGGLGIVDVSDPLHPLVVGAFETGWVRDMAVGQERLYALTAEALHVLNLSDPHAPEETGRLELPDASELALSGDLAFVASQNACLNPDNTGGLAVISLADPDHPALLNTSADIPCGVRDAAVLDGIVVLAAGDAGVLGVDVSDPAAPRLAYRFATPSLATRVAVDGERIYALDEVGGIYVLGLP